MSKRPWIQAAIDVTDIELAKKIAFMALDNGAEWLEVGTPLLYQYGHSAIKMIRDAVGKNAVLVADYKAPFALLAAEQASRAGADYIMLFTTYYDFLIEHSIKTCEKYDIQPIFDLEVKQEDLPSCIEKVRSKGGKYIITRHYSIYGDSISNLTKSDNFPLFEKDRDYYLGITSDNLVDAVDASRWGVDWVTFGLVLRKPDEAACRTWIDSIHEGSLPEGEEYNASIEKFL